MPETEDRKRLHARKAISISMYHFGGVDKVATCVVYVDTYTNHVTMHTRFLDSEHPTLLTLSRAVYRATFDGIAEMYPFRGGTVGWTAKLKGEF